MTRASRFLIDLAAWAITPCRGWLTRTWSHDRAHGFFSHARWSPDLLGIALSHLIVRQLLPVTRRVRRQELPTTGRVCAPHSPLKPTCHGGRARAMEHYVWKR